jgi:hypothetical protein
MVPNAINFVHIAQIMNVKLMGIVWILVLIVLILIFTEMIAIHLVQILITLAAHVPELEFVPLVQVKNFGEINVKNIAIIAHGINVILMELA